MLRKMTTALALTLAALPLSAQDAPPAPPPFTPFAQDEHDRYLARGKQIMVWFLAGRADSLVGAVEPGYAEQLNLDRIRELMDAFAERTGSVSKVLAEKMTRRNGMPQFWWEAEVVNFTDEPVVMRWLLNETGHIVGVGFNPKSRAPFDPGQSS
jgi:hypothetical protein